jgi:hypothetical protein
MAMLQRRFASSIYAVRRILERMTDEQRQEILAELEEVQKLIRQVKISEKQESKGEGIRRQLCNWMGTWVGCLPITTCKLLTDLVGASGFEPPTSWSRIRRSTKGSDLLVIDHLLRRHGLILRREALNRENKDLYDPTRPFPPPLGFSSNSTW